MKIVDPERSLRIRLRKRLNPEADRAANAKKSAARKGRPLLHTPNPAGIGGVMPGEARNPTGKGGFENPSPKQIAGRQKILFRPGNNANPNGSKGKPKDGTAYVAKRDPHRSPEAMRTVLDAKEIQELCRKHVPDGIRALAEIVANSASTDMAKIAAYTALADRGYGRPTQTNVNANIDPDAKPSNLNDADLDRRIAEALERIERATGGTGAPPEGEDGPTDLRKVN